MDLIEIFDFWQSGADAWKVCVCVKRAFETFYPTRDDDERSHDNAQGIVQDFGGC